MINAAVPKLCFLRGSEKLDSRKSELPKRLKLLNWGRNESTEGPVFLDEQTVAIFDANQNLIGRTRCQLDFEHNTVPGTEEYNRTKEPRDVAAFATPKIIIGDGLYFEDIDWKPIGQQSASNFEDLSLAPFLDESRRVIAVHSGALTKCGAVYDIPSFTQQALSTLAATLKTKNTMNQLNADNVILVNDLGIALGLSAGASKADVLAKLGEVTALRSIVTFKDGKIVALSGADIKDHKLSLLDAVTAFDARIKTIEQANNEKVLTLSAVIDGKTHTLKPEDVVGKIIKLESFATTATTGAEEKERGALIERFAAEGKVPKGIDGKELTDEQLKTFNVDSLKLLLANTPATVPLNARGKKPNETKTTNGCAVDTASLWS